MTAIYYDTEFIDNGTTIKLISIGMVAENGRELYCVVDDEDTITEAIGIDWMWKNVIPGLPVDLLDTTGDWDWANKDPDWLRVMPECQVAEEVRNFILSFPDPQLWAWYAAYDHVALAQLFGPMKDLPAGIPMWTNDLRQECQRLGNPQMPTQVAGQHNALADARHNQVMDQFLRRLAFRLEAEAIVAAERGITNA